MVNIGETKKLDTEQKLDIIEHELNKTTACLKSKQTWNTKGF